MLRLPARGNCLATYSYTFTVTVSYTGPWKLMHQGYISLGSSNPTNVTRSDSETRFYSQPITLRGLNNDALTLCAQAQKLENSCDTLVPTVTESNETSVPFGTATYLGGVAP